MLNYVLKIDKVLFFKLRKLLITNEIYLGQDYVTTDLTRVKIWLVWLKDMIELGKDNINLALAINSYIETCSIVRILYMRYYILHSGAFLHGGLDMIDLGRDNVNLYVQELRYDKS